MELGAPVVSPRRFQLRHPVLFAAWDSPTSLDRFLADDPSGRLWSAGWHVRLEFLRRWGHVAAFPDLPLEGPRHDPGEPVVALTLARLKLPQAPRFLRWGRPVERQVRDDPGQTLAIAAAAPPRTVSTFTVWRTAKAMTDMVSGRTSAPDAGRHAAAMGERERKDFHVEFTTLRFRCISEHGSWKGRTNIVPEAYVPVTFDDCDHVTGPFYHGTRHTFAEGDLVEPGHASNYQEGRVSNHVYFAALLEPAVWGAELAVALGGGVDRGHVYVVEPTGPFEDDPNVTNKRFPGNVTRSYRTRHPLRVVGELETWEGHPADVIETMLAGIEQLRQQGLDVIED